MKPRQPISKDTALDRLEALCARSEQAESEVRRKLRMWGVPATDAEEIVESLKKHRFVDDERFAMAYVRDKVVFSRWGRRKILQGLMAKQVDRAIASRALDEIDTEAYESNLEHIARAKAKSAPTLLESFEGRTKLYRFMLSRGYEPELCSQVLRRLLSR